MKKKENTPATGEDRERAQYERMTQSSIPSLVVRMSIPTIVSMMVTNIYNLVDTAFVGQLGNSASAAVGVVFGFMSIIQAIGFMIGQGSGSLISRELGRRDRADAVTTASTGFFLALGAGLLLAVGCFLFLDPLVMLLGSTETAAPYAKTYISYILLATPFMTAVFVMNNILRYEGKASLGMAGLLTGAILNIVGDPIFMFALDMGIAGAGLSTALSQIISFFVLLSMFLRGKTSTPISLRAVALKGRLVPEILATGFPSLLRQGLNSLATILLNDCAGAYGDEAVAAMSIVSRIGFFVFSIALGVGQGFQPICGFNYGAKKHGRVRRAFWFTVALSEGLMAVAAVVVLLFSGGLIGLFRDDPTVIAIGTRALRLYCVAQLFLPICMVTEMLYQSTGHKGGAAILSALRGGLLFIPLLLILVRLRGLAGIQEAQPLAYILALLPSIWFLLRFFKTLPKEDTPAGEG
ncbi:MAG: MATE family efflux transporter [Oscillospiraceae bacterium]|nr:MATE family efflux transporter [Oscillospiraceae bacterium]